MNNEAPKKILIIEDEKSYGRILLERLEREKFEVALETNGKDGIRKALIMRPDLIILDMIMPKMGGLTFLKLLYADDWGKAARVFILSNHDKPDDIAKALMVNDESNVSPQSEFIYLSKVDTGLEEFVEKVKVEFAM